MKMHCYTQVLSATLSPIIQNQHKRNLCRKFQSLFAAMTLLAGSCVAADPAPIQSSKPDIIIIDADDLGWGDLGCYGHPTLRTPNLDRMAAEGTRFTSFYCPAPICSPSRAGLLTGQIPQRIGMYGIGGDGVLFPNSTGGLPTNEPTIANVVSSVGYRSIVIGKWHLGHAPEHVPMAHGFTSWFGLPYSNDMSCKRVPLPLIDGLKVVMAPVPQAEIGQRLTDRAVAELAIAPDKPLFLLFTPTAPHTPLATSHPGRSRRGLYGDVIEDLDEQVGQIMDAVKRRGRPTLVWFTSDNGPWTVKRLEGGSAGLLRGGKMGCWEGGMRVPGIAWWPGVVPAGRIVMDPISHLDLFPTCAELAGAPLPKTTLDGSSLVPLLQGSATSPRTAIWYHWQDKVIAVRQGKWKLVTDPDHIAEWIGDDVAHRPPRAAKGAPAQTRSEAIIAGLQKRSLPQHLLFDVEADPGESCDLSDKQPEILAKLKALIAKPPCDIAPSRFAGERIPPERVQASFSHFDWSAISLPMKP